MHRAQAAPTSRSPTHGAETVGRTPGAICPNVAQCHAADPEESRQVGGVVRREIAFYSFWNFEAGAPHTGHLSGGVPHSMSPQTGQM